MARAEAIRVGVGASCSYYARSGLRQPRGLLLPQELPAVTVPLLVPGRRWACVLLLQATSVRPDRCNMSFSLPLSLPSAFPAFLSLFRPPLPPSLSLEQFGSAPEPVELLPHDGACNTMPGWSVTWAVPNVKEDPDCKAFPFYAHRGLGSGASYGQSNYAIGGAAQMANAKA